MVNLEMIYKKILITPKFNFLKIRKKMNIDRATYEALLLEAEASGLDKTETMAFLSNQGIPLEVITRIDFLWDQTVIVGNQILHIGKIIIKKLIQFIDENPHMLIGLALGIGLALLVASVPYIGSLIAPVVTIAFSTIGALKGYKLDSIINGEYVDDVIVNIILIVKKFWDFLYDVFNTIIVNPIDVKYHEKII